MQWGKTKGEEVVYKGIPFRRYPDSPNYSDRQYYRPSSSYIVRGVQSLHREMWADAYGPIPDGCEIHHRDGNAGNNVLSNLECVPSGEHQRRHGAELTGEQREQLRQRMEHARKYASAWHGSPEGRAWHSALGKLAWANAEPTILVCEQCGKEFDTLAKHENVRFCSNNCKAAWRRASGVDNEDRVCAVCGKTFTVNKYRPTRHCSRLCAGRARRAKRTGGL